MYKNKIRNLKGQVKSDIKVNKKPTLFLFLILLHFSIKAQVNIGDSLALVDLYNSTNGGYWKYNTNWLTNKVSEWHGIKVSNNRVTGIYLINNHLEGTLPASLGNLTEITDLYLNGNKLSGNIPKNIGNLTALIYLYLNNNQIQDSIPTEIGNTTALKELHLEHNNLSGTIPVSLRSLRQLREVVLSYNQLSGNIPKEPGGKQIMRLELNNNQLTGNIPPELQDIRNLRIVKLNNNLLTGEIPLGLAPAICYLLDLSSNQLTGNIPSDLGNNSTLSHINLNNNQLTGTIPASIGDLSNLQILRLDNNQLTGNIPVSFNRLLRLVQLNLMNNQLSGNIPSGLCSLPELQSLQLNNNQFTFDGIECIGQIDKTSLTADFNYQNQKTLTLNQKLSTLSLYAGGTVENNTYYVYKDSILVKTVKGDSSFTVNEGGKYWVEVTNDKASKLTLYSNPIDVIHNIILPLYWMEFTAKECSGNVCLQWQTENEQNTSHFEIEKSTDGMTFTKFESQKSTNQPGKHRYQATDNNPVSGINYYRIKQIDVNGSYTYSTIITIKIDSPMGIKIVPNPANNYIILKGDSNAKSVSVYNITGQLQTQWNDINNNQQLNISHLSEGIYIIKVLQNNKESAHKLIKH